MISLEQVRQLETRVAKAIEYVQRVNAENAALVSERAGLQAKLSANQKRIDELEVLVMRFKEDQGRIEDGIIAALDRLSQFEEAFENSLKENVNAKKQAAKAREKSSQPDSANQEVYFEIPEKETGKISAVSNEPPPEAPGAKGVSTTAGELDIF